MFTSTAPSLPPQNVTVTSTDPASLKVHWELPSDKYCAGPITGHVIQYTRIGSKDKMTIKVDGEPAQYTISGLVASQEYFICVATVNGNITGLFSEAVVEVAGEDGELCIHTYM